VLLKRKPSIDWKKHCGREWALFTDLTNTMDGLDDSMFWRHQLTVSSRLGRTDQPHSARSKYGSSSDTCAASRQWRGSAVVHLAEV
jgi:hypothetical protein